MELSYKKLGAGPPLIILHGLFGSSDNWFSVGRELASDFEVYLVDQRNHGNSPHHVIHNYQALSDDIHNFLGEHNLMHVNVIGHSMGGKAGLLYGLQHPCNINKMAVVDISPFAYSFKESIYGSITHSQIIRGLLSIDPDLLMNRAEADLQLQQFVPSMAVRQFLLKNLKRTADGKFLWTLNLSALADNLHEIFAGVTDEFQQKAQNLPVFPLLFIRGQRSEYISASDEKAINTGFPHAKIVTVQDAGHWVHAEQPVRLLEIFREFFKE
jgi:esterase